MQTELTCPSCQTPYPAELHRIIDVGLEPELKSALLGGQLNLAQCPVCGTVTQVNTPLLYHDPEHELFMVYMPMEMSLAHAEQEKLIGQLVQEAMNRLPAEQRRGYMFQPQTVLSFQTLLETVLGTEGITPEMIAHQRAQSELLQTLLTADKNTADELIAAREDDIDEAFFALLRALLDAAQAANQEDQVLKLVNLQAKLYRQTEFGRALEKRQQALHAFSREASEENALTPKLLLKHVLANRRDEQTVEALIAAGQPAFNYEFFVLLSERIEKRQKAGVAADELLALRERLLEIQQSIEQRTREILQDAQGVLRQLLEANDKEAAVRANLNRIDDSVMYVLAASITQAEQQRDETQFNELRQIQNLIVAEMENQAPAEIRFINSLLRTEDDDQRQQLFQENEGLVTPELLQVVKAIEAQAAETGDKDLDGRLKQLQTMIEVHLQR